MRNCQRFLVAGIAGFGLLVAAQGQALAWEDHLACYKSDLFPKFRIKLDVKYHSHVSEPAEETAFGHAHQKAFSVHGKAINGCYYGSMAPATGTIVVGERVNSGTTGATGAHLSLRDNLVREDYCAPLSLDCTTDEQSHVPDYWLCYARNDYGRVFEFRLSKTVESRDPYCSTFEDSVPVRVEATSEAAPNQREEERPAPSNP